MRAVRRLEMLKLGQELLVYRTELLLNRIIVFMFDFQVELLTYCRKIFRVGSALSILAWIDSV
jgi:hypothetical protein